MGDTHGTRQKLDVKCVPNAHELHCGAAGAQIAAGRPPLLKEKQELACGGLWRLLSHNGDGISNIEEAVIGESGPGPTQSTDSANHCSFI